MAVAPSAGSVHEFPPALVAAAAADAARDADRVCLFLDHLGLGPTPDKPRRWPARFLLHLGAALRLVSWEAQGFSVHREAGLPDAWQAIRDAVLSLEDPSEFCVAVLRLSVERFAWLGRSALGSDVALDDITDDAALDALAEFLWANRHLELAAISTSP